MINPVRVVQQLGHLFALKHHLVGDVEVADVLQVEAVSQESVENLEILSVASFSESHSLGEKKQILGQRIGGFKRSPQFSDSVRGN